MSDLTAKAAPAAETESAAAQAAANPAAATAGGVDSAAASAPAASDSAADATAAGSGGAVAPDGDNAIVFTDSAARKVRALIDEEGNPDLKLRVFIAGGGCSGFQYGFTFDDTANDDDAALEKMGVVVLVDPMSYQYLVGAEIDYQEKLEGSQFVIRNPNVTSTCGCGSSFAV